MHVIGLNQSDKLPSIMIQATIASFF